MTGQKRTQRILRLQSSLMRYMKWIGLAVAVLMIISCFSPWVIIESKNITISGIDASGTNFGKPGYFHLLMTAFFLAFSFIQKLWAKRANLLITALNLGWAIRNYLIISACAGGECPVKKSGMYMMLLASVLMLVAALFPDIKLPEDKPSQTSTRMNPSDGPPKEGL